MPDLKHDDSKADKEGTDETTTEILTLGHVLKKRSPETDEDVENYEDEIEINVDETFKNKIHIPLLPKSRNWKPSRSILYICFGQSDFSAGARGASC